MDKKENKKAKTNKKTKKSISKKLKENLNMYLSMSPLLEGLLEEIERIENIRNSLYKAYSEGDLFEEYTNKIGATNLVVNAALKEYKSYSQRFNDLTKTLHNIIKDIAPQSDADEPDDFEKLLGRGKRA